ncbi:MAG: CBS domain-containing protein [Saprospiraceae bacterium]|nr:CBS domain-containing protein [Saprospiraceae bacterium]
MKDRFLSWASALRIGSHTFPATLLLVMLATFAALGLGPSLHFVFGSGWVAPLVLTLLLFFALMFFKNLIFKNIYKNAPTEGEAALLEYLVQQNVSGTPGEEEVEMELLENALHLKQVRAHDCMAPRPEIVHIDVQASVAELRQLFIESSLSRILVTEGELDNVLGYVHVQQLFSKPSNIRSIVMPIKFVPETIQVNDLLNKFIKNRTNIACVVDEYGSLAGLVTLEDALEQLFGDIDDEHDQEEFIEVQISDKEYLLSGRLDVDYLNEKYPALALPEGDYNTLSGYLVMTTQTIPEQGARLELDGKTFVLELVSDKKIETVRVLLQ